MNGGVCYKKNFEKGAWFQIKCVRDNIISKESRGHDASFERSLLKSWSSYPGYEDAADALKACGHS